MLNQKIQDALNEQIKNELYSAYLYLSMYGGLLRICQYAGYGQLDAHARVGGAGARAQDV